MEIRVDGEPLQLSIAEDGSVMDALAQVSEHLRSLDKAMVGMRIDGIEVRPEDLRKTFEGRPAQGVHKVEVHTENVMTLVDNCLKDLEELLPELPMVCHHLAETFQGESPEAGFEPFDQLAHIWQTVKERELLVARTLNVDIDTLELQGTTLGRLHTELNEFLDEAIEGLKAGDCVVLGDLLEYEFAPRAEQELQIVSLLRERAQACRR